MALEENLDVVFRDPRLRPPQAPGSSLSFNELTSILEKVDLSEVAFEGQEASLDPSLPEICHWLKNRNCRVVLHTNGVQLADTADIDDVIVSLKAVTPELYKDYTGHANDSVLNNFVTYRENRVNLKAESVFIPEYIGFGETLSIAKFVASVDRMIPLRIDAYFESGDNPWQPPTPEQMLETVSQCRKYLDNVYSTQQTKRELTKADLLYEVIRLF